MRSFGDIESAIRRLDSDEASDRLTSSVLSRSDAARVLLELARSRDLGVREWAVGAIPRLPEEEAIPILTSIYLNERDLDVRDDALSRLVAIDPRAAQPLAAKVRRAVESPDSDVATDAMWALLAMQDVAILERLDTIAQDQRYATGKIAAICAAGLRGDEGWIMTRLLGHQDHYQTVWLARAASVVASSRLLAALEEAAESLPDDECREFCRSYLAVRRR